MYDLNVQNKKKFPLHKGSVEFQRENSLALRLHVSISTKGLLALNVSICICDDVFEVFRYLPSLGVNSTNDPNGTQMKPQKQTQTLGANEPEWRYRF